MALSLGSSLLYRPKAPDVSTAATDRLTANIDPRTPRKFVFGTTAFATDIRDQELTGNEKELLHRFIVTSSHQVDSFAEIWLDDKLAWTASGGIASDFQGYLGVECYTVGGPASAKNISARMGSTRRYTGCSWVYLRFKLTGNSKKAQSPFAQSIPSRVTIVGNGALTYDPRLDSTVPGGSGPMRAGDQTTWQWNADASRNPALQLLWYLLGWRIQNPATGEWRLAVGKGIPASRIDLASFITAANLCDEPVSLIGGGTQPRYRSDGLFSEGDATSTVLDQLKAAMNAELDDVDGKIRITVLHNDLATPVADFSEDDILSGFTWEQTAPLDQSFNVVRGTFIDPSSASLFQAVDYPEVRIPSPDDIDRIETVNFQTVQDGRQAQRLAKQRVARMLYSGRFSATFSYRAWKVQKNDVIRLTFAPLGFANKLFRVIETAVQVDGQVPMVLQVEHPDIYLWDRDERADIQPVEPTTYDPYLNPVYQGIEEAGGTAIWDNIIGEGKPEDNATVGATPAERAKIDTLDSDIAAAKSAIAQAQADIAEISGAVEGDFGRLMQAINDLENEVDVVKGNITSLQSATSAVQQSVNGLQTGLSGAQGSIADLQSQAGQIIASIGQVGTEVDQLEATVSTQGGYITTLQQSVTGLSGSVSTLSQTVATQGASISTNAQAITTLQGSVSSLNTIVTASSSPNLAANGGFENGLRGWSFAGPGYNQWVRNVWAWGCWAGAPGFTGGGGNNYAYIESTDWFGLAGSDSYALSFDYDMPGQAGSLCYGEIVWFTSTGQIIASAGGPAWGAKGFDRTGNSRYKATFNSPSNAGGAKVRVVFYAPDGVSTGSINVRQIKFEFGSVATPYSGEATARQTYQAYADLNSSFASLETRVSSAEGSVTSLSQSLTNANGSISSLQQSVSSLNGSVSSLAQSASTQAGQISALQISVNTQGASISTNAQAITTLQGSVSSLNTIVTASSSPNLAANGGFENGLRGWSFAGPGYNQWVRNVWAWGCWAGAPGFTGGGGNNHAYIESTDWFGLAGSDSYALSFDYDMPGQAGSLCYGEIVWFTSTGQIIASAGGPAWGAKGFDRTGNSRYKATFNSPSNAGGAKVRVVFYAPDGVSTGSINVRQIKFEFGSVATPYSGEATANQMFTAYSDLNSSFASLSTTVSSQGGSITTLQQSFTSLNGTVSSLSQTVSAQGGSISSLQQVQSTQAGAISTLQTQVTAGGGNLLQNTDFAIDTSAWSFQSSAGVVSYGERVGAGGAWVLADENAVRIAQDNSGTSGYADWTQMLSVQEGLWYDISCRVAAHRCSVEVIIQWRDANLNVLSADSAGAVNSPASGGNALSGWYWYGLKRQAPAGAARATLYLRKYATNGGQANSYAWFCRPQVAETRPSSASPIAYSPGSARASIGVQAQAISSINSQQASLTTTVNAHSASISQNATAISTLQGQQASLSSTVSTQGAAISSLQTVTSTLQGDAASLRTQVQAGGGNNLVRNGGFENGLNGWDQQGQPWGAAMNTTYGNYAYRGSLGPSNANVWIDTPRFNVDATGQYTASFDFDVWAANNDSFYVRGELLWFESNGVEIARAYGPNVGGNASRGFWYGNGSQQNRKDVSFTATAPSGTVQGLLRCVAGSGQLGGFAVAKVKVEKGTFATPYTADATITQTFEALSSLDTQYASLSSTVGVLGASVSTNASAISNLQGQYASLSSTVSTLGASVTVQSQAISTLQNRNAAFFQVEAVAAGRAQLRVYADANGGAGVDIIGDLGVSGNGIFGGTINPEALKLERFMKKTVGGGSGTPAAGQNLLIYTANMGQTLPNGIYSIEFTGNLQTNVGRSTTTVGNKPYYVNRLPDGGIRLIVTKGSTVVVDQIYTANEWISTNSTSLRETSFVINKIIDPDNDTATGDAVVSIYAIRGSVDTGQVDNGDYYQRDISAEYVGVNANARVRWTFI